MTLRNLYSGGRPTARAVQHSRNLHRTAFAAHRMCSSADMTYEGDSPMCKACGNKWLLSRDSRGEPVGYRLLPKVNVAGLVD